MKELEKIIAKRDKARKLERELTQKIKDERRKISQARTKPTKKGVTIEYSEYAKMRDENAKLRGIICMIYKADDKTFKEIAEMLGVSVSRARQIMNNALRRLRVFENT